MRALRYPRVATAADLARAAAGATAVGVPLAAADPPGWLVLLLVAALALFAAHALGACARAMHRVCLERDGLVIQPRGVRIPWRALETLDLRYYSTRRDGERGWLELRLHAGSARARIDSRLDGFRGVLERATRAARERDLALSAATVANLARLGLSPPEPRR